MSQKNETTRLVLTLLVTAGLLVAGGWFLVRMTRWNVGNLMAPLAGGNSAQSQLGQTVQLPQRPLVERLTQVQNVPSGLFNYGGSTSWAPIRGLVDPLLQMVWPQFKLRYIHPTTGSPGSSQGIQMLLGGQIAFAHSSRLLTPQEVAQARQLGFQLQEIPVALEGIAIAVHPELNVFGLTLEQLKAIYTGQVNNWNQVGGPNLPMTPYSRPPGSSGSVDFFVKSVLDSNAFSNNVKFLETTTQALRQLSLDRSGIYFASASEVVPQCGVKTLSIGRSVDALVPPYQQPLVPLSQCPTQRNQLNREGFRNGQYLLTRPLFVIVKQNNTLEQQVGEAYADLLLSKEGQQLISRAGFVEIR